MRIGSLPQAFPYQGSKRKLTPVIMQCIPLGTECLIEPFAGSAAVAVAAAWSKRARNFWLNDAHVALMKLWGAILEEPEALLANYQRIWEAQDGRSHEHYNEVRAEFNRTHAPELLLFLLARCVKAAIRYNRNGEFNNSPDHRRKGMIPATMSRNIRFISELLRGRTKTTRGDYKKALQEATASDLVYMDPPYQGVCQDRDCRYVESVVFEEFVAELAKLDRRRVPFVVNYDGRTGDKTYGKTLPTHLGLVHVELRVGRSTQATLLGRNHETFESLYVSRSAIQKLGGIPAALRASDESALLFA